MIEGSKILLVDDNADIIDAMSDFLTLNGCNVYVAPTGKKAMELLNNKNDIEVVILDVRLPDTNGVDLLDTIKINNPTVAVVMATGYYNPNYVVEAMKKGASDFLIKPFEFDKLMLVLIRALRERSLLIEKENIYQTLEDKKKIELLNRELQKKIKELTTMYQISNQFNALTIFNDVYEKMLNIVYDALEVKSCGYYIFDNKNRELILYKEKTNNGNVLESRVPLSGDFFEHIRTQRKYLSKNHELYLPINIKGECIGFIMVDSKRNGLKKDDHLPDSDIFFLKLIAEKASTQIENRMLYESLFENVFQTLTSLIAAINKRDSYTESHCHRVTDMTMLLADKMDLADYEKDVLRFVGPVHDLGKVGIPDSILLKPGGLSDEEYNMMKSHSAFGEEILSRFDILSKEATIIRSHHERYDGRGYPDALAKDEIPLCSRVIAVCDTFDAMTTNRPYRTALEKERALNEIERCKGSQFDPDIADFFLEMAKGNFYGN